ncbi:MAG: sulfatase-like hydrolase/transferase [Clostridia bacterium]|nr:sulfatase-like hydrolase/transferase [Clostridia bacterium]
MTRLSRREIRRTSPETLRKEKKDGFITWLIETGLLVLCAVFTEVVLHFLIFGSADGRIVFKILFGVCFGLFAALIASFLPATPRRIFIIVAVLVSTLLAEIQLIYHAIFGNLMPLSLTRMGGGVVTNFGGQIGYAVAGNLFRVIVLALPVLAAIVSVIILKRHGRVTPPVRCRILSIGAFLSAVILVWSAMFSGRDDPQSAYRIFTDSGTGTDTSYKTIGMWATTLQETRYMLFGSGGSVSALIPEPDEGKSYSADKYNVIEELDFRTLAEQSGEDEDAFRELDRFFTTASPTEKNEYTGMLKGYNVITFCAESYSPHFISKELTPTLYEMIHHGFVFENYYGSFPSVTTNGEYTMCTGLLPDMTRTKTQSSFDVSIGHYLPFCLGNALREEGYDTYAYHNYLGDFYNRSLTHPNMGYDFRAVGQGLDITLSWPASDDAMIRASLKDYVKSEKPFHVYYMTFSGHYQYNWDNAMSRRHQTKVSDLPYSEEVKAYIACNLEVEDALTTLLNKLKEEGIAEKTLIVLTNDHYPYGLSEEQYNELAGKKIDTVFERFRNSFICYVPGMKDVFVDAYCSTADILPTLLNLLGVRYDSRLLAGVDVLAPGDHTAILADGSFLTKDFRYNSETGEIIKTDPYADLDAESVERTRTAVSNRFGFSNRILNSDYYAHVFGKEPSGERDSVVFTDIKSVFVQNYVNFLYRHGFISADGRDEFGAERIAEFGELLDVFYRMSGSPEVSGIIPDWYNRDGETETDSPWRDAVVWAIENGVLRNTDRDLPKPSDPIDSRMMIITLYRVAGTFGVNTDLGIAEGLAKAKNSNPDIDEETLKATEFVFTKGIYVGRTGTRESLWHPDRSENAFTRGRMSSVLFNFYTRLVDKTGK